ncbi:hypothetical protein BJ875DRAFT_275589 [Amylocarpus encephaloides]|uniref:AMP-dependent synthetase/ligase domain-containing protein n=1 Tax=Amylocarpus encephaloides TaxID=45428 RepID=A0A9P7YTU3_9HELO|nr:hypothetical protein BJ875DRAFT_275589 [Amylocarpus encephaloides]
MGDLSGPYDLQRTPFPVLIDHVAKDSPDRTFAIVPRTRDLEDGYQDFTYGELSKAVDRMSWWLDCQLGKATTLETVAYLGVGDLRYTFLYYAALKTRRMLLLPSNQNSRDAHLSILDAVECEVLIASADQIPVWESLRPEIDSKKVITIPELEYFLLEAAVESYPFNLTWADIKDDPIIVMHTSGSTGLPKPIKYTSHMLSIFDTGDVESFWVDTKILVPLPPSWILGLYLHILAPMQRGTIPISLPLGAPLPMTAEYMDKVHTTVKVETGVYIPYVLEQLSRNPEYLSNMHGFTRIFFGGAPLRKEIGDIFAQFTHVQPLLGATEIGSYGLRVGDQTDWMYYNFDPSTGSRFIPFHEDLFEGVIVKHKDPQAADAQMIFHVFPDIDVYHTSDVWKKHPTKEELWMFSGRTDDFVKLRSMTKFNAKHVEGLLLKDPRVTGAIMGGDGKDWPFLLLEANCEGDIEIFWPLIENINQDLSEMIEVKKDKVILIKQGKLLERGVKGEVNRKAGLEAYDIEIEALY